MAWIPYPVNTVIKIVEMFSFFQVNYEKTFSFEGEMHPFWECLYVLKGSISVSADDRLYDLNEGDIIFHKPLEMHKFDVTSDGVTSLIVFTFNAEGELVNHFFDKVYNLSKEQKRIIYELIDYAKSKIEDHDYTKLFAYLFLDQFKNNRFYSQVVASYIERLMISLADDGLETSVSDSHDSILFGKAVAYMNEKILENPSIYEIARHVGTSSASLKRIFSKHTSLGVHKFFLILKLKSAAEMLSYGATVTEVADKFNFSSQGYFSKVFKKELGVNPSAYSKER
ncbi:MAG: helix-turn-helix domain-containing protein [Ruminococcaceae bacterium]|nr:helix-turn-helix domain-containing protein [Oscillospiraceae bacterium]